MSRLPINGTGVHVKQESLHPGDNAIPSVDLSSASIKRELPEHPNVDYDDMDHDGPYGMQGDNVVAEDLSMVTDHSDNPLDA